MRHTRTTRVPTGGSILSGRPRVASVAARAVRTVRRVVSGAAAVTGAPAACVSSPPESLLETVQVRVSCELLPTPSVAAIENVCVPFASPDRRWGEERCLGAVRATSISLGREDVERKLGRA